MHKFSPLTLKIFKDFVGISPFGHTDSDQIAWMHRLILVFIGRICQKVRFLILLLS